MKDFPSLNAAFTDQRVELYSDINIGMAVALEEGLVVPVIRNADRLSLQELAKQSRELADKAQKKKLFPLDYEGGTFTVSNLGMFGVDSFIAIIKSTAVRHSRRWPSGAARRPPRRRHRGSPDDDHVHSTDHRVVDGAIAARFLQEVKRLREAPDL